MVHEGVVTMSKNALIVGAGAGISAAFARALAKAGYEVGLASRDPGRLREFASAIGARAFACDASDAGQVRDLFAKTDEAMGPPDIVLFNASRRYRGPFLELDGDEVRRALLGGAHAGFLVAQEAAHRMVPRGSGAIFFTGASASVKGYAGSAPFAMQKFALRGLAQSLARELSPQGIHVAHFVIDGRVRPVTGVDPGDTMLDPDAIAATYLAVLNQPRSAWTWEIELRPFGETF
jgi:NAD(P)-dependent dehydrogenase (short-subunit alcohol dehydrogenase family)